MKNSVTVCALLFTVACRPAPTRVVFLCEHGSAKSVIASFYLNKMAEDKGLDWIALARGVKADSTLQATTRKGLAADGFDISAFHPSELKENDIASADVVVTIGCAMPHNLTTRARHVAWDDVPPVSEDYAAARDVLIGHLNELLP